MKQTQPRVIVSTPESAAGAGHYVAELVKALVAAGVPTVLFCPGNFAYAGEVLASGAEIHCSPFREIIAAGLPRRIVRNLAYVFKSIPVFARIIRPGDIVHFQFALRFGLGLLFFAIARLRGAHVVMTAHDPLPHRWTLPRVLRFFEAALLGIGYSFCDRIIVHNQSGAAILHKVFGVPEDQLAVIPHGPLNLNPRHTAVDNSLPDTPLRLLTFGSLRRNKGLHLAIAAMQELERSAPGKVTLTIAGKVANVVEASYWDDCRKQIRLQPQAITLIERLIEDDEIETLFSSHHAVLLPYTDFFSDSGVAMLSLSQGRAIISSHAGGLGELQRATDCGIAIGETTVAGIRQALEKALATGPERLLAKGLNGKHYISRERSWASIAKRTSRVYDGLNAAPRVVLHTPESFGSPALYMDELTRALADDGVATKVVCPENLQTRASMEGNARIRVYPCAARATGTAVPVLRKIADNGRFLCASCCALLRATGRGDIVHFQYILHLPFGLIFFLCALLKGARIVFTVHDPLPHKWLFHGLLQKFEFASLRLAYRLSDILIVHSDAGAQKLRDVFGVPKEKIRVVVHGPYRLPAEVRAAPESEPLEVLLFGSFRENKGLHLAIEAAQILERAQVPVRLTIAGQVVNRKEIEYWNHCRQLIDPQSRAVRLIEGYVPDSALPELFSQHHCFLLPYTAFSSDSGVAYLALANGKPIISTKAGGLGWLLENSGGGLTITEPTCSGVESALRYAVALGPQKLAEMGRRGAAWVLSECGWPKVARDTRAVYAQFIPALQAETAAEPDDERQLQQVLAGEGV